MIGFISRADVPRLILSFIVGIGLLLIVGSTFEHFQLKGQAAAIVFLVALVGIFKFSEWAGKAIWERWGG